MRKKGNKKAANCYNVKLMMSKAVVMTLWTLTRIEFWYKGWHTLPKMTILLVLKCGISFLSHKKKSCLMD